MILQPAFHKMVSNCSTTTVTLTGYSQLVIFTADPGVIESFIEFSQTTNIHISFMEILYAQTNFYYTGTIDSMCLFS